jgi:hypothetical protein
MLNTTPLGEIEEITCRREGNNGFEQCNASVVKNNGEKAELTINNVAQVNTEGGHTQAKPNSLKWNEQRGKKFSARMTKSKETKMIEIFKEGEQ